MNWQKLICSEGGHLRAQNRPTDDSHFSGLPTSLLWTRGFSSRLRSHGSLVKGLPGRPPPPRRVRKPGWPRAGRSFQRPRQRLPGRRPRASARVPRLPLAARAGAAPGQAGLCSPPPGLTHPATHLEGRTLRAELLAGGRGRGSYRRGGRRAGGRRRRGGGGHPPPSRQQPLTPRRPSQQPPPSHRAPHPGTGGGVTGSPARRVTRPARQCRCAPRREGGGGWSAGGARPGAGPRVRDGGAMARRGGAVI